VLVVAGEFAARRSFGGARQVIVAPAGRRIAG
jgi:hypothetical protein